MDMHCTELIAHNTVSLPHLAAWDDVRCAKKDGVLENYERGGSSSYRRAPGESTEWEDIQRRLGNLPKEPAKEESEDDEPEAPRDPLAGKDIDALEGDEDDDEFADDRALDELRRQRLEQLRSLAKENRFGNVKGITRSEFISEVSEASKEIWVVVALYSDSVEESRTFVACLDVLAPRHPAVKFIKMIGTDCIPDYPESNLPTVLLYHEGEMKHRIVGVRPFGGRGKLSPDSIEWVLHRAGVVHTELEEDPRGEDQDDGWGRAGRTWQVTRSADDLE